MLVGAIARYKISKELIMENGNHELRMLIIDKCQN